ncbi:hypothetical protein PSPO01_11828 [Paraphaeosphaeria sporulosa]
MRTRTCAHAAPGPAPAGATAIHARPHHWAQAFRGPLIRHDEACLPARQQREGLAAATNCATGCACTPTLKDSIALTAEQRRAASCDAPRRALQKASPLIDPQHSRLILRGAVRSDFSNNPQGQLLCNVFDTSHFMHYNVLP